MQILALHHHPLDPLVSSPINQKLPGDTLREDEKKFMDVDKNFFVFCESAETVNTEFSMKLFYVASTEQQMKNLDSYPWITKISDNFVSGHQDILAIPEYGIKGPLRKETITAMTREIPKIFFTRSFN